jgi:hypothetical protein
VRRAESEETSERRGSVSPFGAVHDLTQSLARTARMSSITPRVRFIARWLRDDLLTAHRDPEQHAFESALKNAKAQADVAAEHRLSMLDWLPHKEC